MMRRLTILLAALLLNGCFIANDFARINQIQKIQEDAAASYPKSYSESFKHEKDFLQCMQDYGKSNAGTTIEPSALADAAVESCNIPLQYYDTYRNSYYVGQSIARGEDYRYRQENNERKLQNDINQLTIKGKRLTVSEVVKLRLKK